MKPVVVPAIIAGTQEELDSMLHRLSGIADRIMLDIMDGKYVETQSLNFNIKLPEGPEYEAHMMVENPLDYANKLGNKITRVIIHLDSVISIEDTVQKVKQTGREVYVALNPDMGTSILKGILDKIDGILIMTVVPGRYGAKFIPEALSKVREIRCWSRDIPIEVDGGMNPETARMAVEAGATVIASGSYILKSKDVKKAIMNLSDTISP